MQTNSGNKALGEFIKKTRISNNITSSKMANKLKIPESSYLMYESGEQSILVDHLFEISIFLKVDIQELINVYSNEA